MTRLKISGNGSVSRSKSSKAWLKEHFDDQWVRKAQADGWRSRAAFKLIEIDDKDRLLHPGAVVVDLGAAPGGWSQVAASRVGETGQVFALDILDMPAIPDVIFLQGDFREHNVLDQLEQYLNAHMNGRAVDVVLSDMAPNISGMKAVDIPRAMYLAELALDFAIQHLRPGGSWLCKVFQGEGFDQLLQQARDSFGKVITRKPQASRPRSKEVYLLGRDKRAL